MFQFLRLFPILSMTSALLLTACGGGSSFVAEDHSTDYKFAKALPPLKKTSPVITQKENEGTVELAAINSVPLAVELVEVGKYLRVGMNRPLDKAWAEAARAATRAGITIHNRNQSEWRFYISCGDDIQTSVVKKSRWKLFEGDVELNQHCAIEIIDSGDFAYIRLLDRAAQEVEVASSTNLLNSLYSQLNSQLDSQLNR